MAGKPGQGKSSTQEKGIDDAMAALHLLSDSSDEDGDTHSSQGDSENNTTCPKCGIKYGEMHVVQQKVYKH